MADTHSPHEDAPAPTMSKTKLKQIIWPDPLQRFGLELLASKISASKTVAEHFPSARFIFPTAKKRRSTVLKRVPIHQWFDNCSLEDPSERQHLQYDGIRETSEFVKKLIDEEAKLIRVERVIVGGLSQGCAAALHILLNSGYESPMAGFIGMSGWSPFADALDPATADKEDASEDEDDIFGSDGGDEDEAERSEGEYRSESHKP